MDDNRLIPVPPDQYRALVLAGRMPRWEKWKELYNAGFLGEALNGWLRQEVGSIQQTN